jgi:hypothetical protein
MSAYDPSPTCATDDYYCAKSAGVSPVIRRHERARDQ